MIYARSSRRPSLGSGFQIGRFARHAEPMPVDGQDCDMWTAGDAQALAFLLCSKRFFIELDRGVNVSDREHGVDITHRAILSR